LTEIPGLREAVIAEAKERENRAAVALKAEQAIIRVTDATAERHATRARAAAGESVTLTKVEGSLRTANDEAALYKEALELADQRLAEATADVNAILRQENDRLVAVARANLDQAQTEFMAAIRARAAAAEALEAAKRGAAMTPDTARRIYAAEIASVG
jgi:hypothetical protein